MSSQLPVTIAGTGAYVPERVVDNHYFASRLDTSDEWIVTRTGIRERRAAASTECTSTMGVEAAKRALADARLTPDDIDVIICATATPDHPFPATACFIQAGIGARHIPAFDVHAACSGFLYGSIVASSLLMSGLYQTALVVGAETLTRYADPEDRATCVLFGDAAGAVIWKRETRPDHGVLHWSLGCDGTKTDHICVPSGGSRLYTSPATTAERLHYLRMRGREVYKFAVLKMQELIDDALAKVGIAASDLAMVIPHQSNLRIIESARERLGLPPEKVAVNIDRFGNTSSASVLLSLDEHRRSGLLKAGDMVLFVAVGAGLTWGIMVVRL